MSHKPKVLFFSTGNAERSQMAGCFLEKLTAGAVVAESTAVKSTDVSSIAMEVMQEIGIDMTGHHAKPVAQSLKEHFVCVVTLADSAKERDPIWPFTPNLVHWHLADPSATGGSPEQRREAFRRVRDEIQRNVRNFAKEVAPQLHMRFSTMQRH